MKNKKEESDLVKVEVKAYLKSIILNAQLLLTESVLVTGTPEDDYEYEKTQENHLYKTIWRKKKGEKLWYRILRIYPEKLSPFLGA